MSRSRLAAATAADCDWSVVDEPGFIEAVARAANKACNRFPDVASRYDAEQDAWMWLVVRPEVIEQYRESEEWKLLGHTIYSHGLRKALIAQSNRQGKTVSREALLEREDDA